MRGNDYMSSSSKKKLRKEQVAEKLTEKQLAEQKEANRRQMSVNNVVGVDKNEVSNMRS